MARRSTTLHDLLATSMMTTIVLLMLSGCPWMSASALNVAISNCTGTLPEGDLIQDLTVILLETDEFICDSMVTLRVNGPYKVELVSTRSSVRVENVRFEITGGAEVSLDFGDADEEGEAIFVGTTDMASDGGVFHVGSNSSATFISSVYFEDNSVTGDYSGGAIYTDGEVVFMQGANFTGNGAGSGAAIAVGTEGSVMFDDFSYFMSNTANSGGQGGAISNLGQLTFGRASYFRFNEATGGEGGALYTGEDATTVFQRRTIMQYNEAGSGGALYNLGDTELESRGFLRENQALGTAADGGHVFNLGSLKIGRLVNFRDGYAQRNGGAIYVGTGATVIAEGGTLFDDNEAVENCDNAYLQSSDSFTCDSELPDE